MTSKSFSSAILDKLLNVFADRFNNDLSIFTPLYIRDIHLGFVNETFAQLIKRDIDTVEYKDGKLNIPAQTWILAGDLLQNTALGWHESGAYDGWRNEKFTVTDISGNPLFDLERSAFRPLGFLSHAIHINAWLERNQQQYFWIGKRSPFKAVSPNKLDTLVGGGIAAGETIFQAAIREGFEEAGLPEKYIKNQTPSGQIFSLRKVHRGLHREILHIFDILLPDNWQPENQDGEVAGFTLMSPNEIVHAIINDEFMNDAALALLNTMQRQGYIDKNHQLNQFLNQLEQNAESWK